MPTNRVGSIISRMKVKTKIVVLLIFIAYFSIFLTSIVSYTVGRNIINERIESELDFTARSVLDAINNLIYDRFSDLQILAGDPVLTNPFASDEQKTESLEASLLRLGWYENLYFVDTKGVIRASTDSSTLDTSLMGETWYDEIKDEYLHVTDAFPSPFTQKSVLFYSNQIRDESNNPLGIVLASFPLEIVNDLLKEAPEGFEVFLINENGSVIASRTESGYPRVEEANREFLVNQQISEGYLGFNGNGWRLTAQIPKSIAYQPLDRFAILIWLTVVVISLEVMFVGSVAAQRFVKPITQLSEGVAKMAEGDLNQVIEIQNQDEIGFLAKNFNSMTHSLAQKTQDLITERGKYRSILESSTDGIILFDKGNRVIAFNQRFSEILNERPGMGDKADQLLVFLREVNAEDPEAKIPELLRIIEQVDLKTSLNAVITLPSHQYKILAVYTKPVLDNAGETLGRIWGFLDITKESESENSRQEFLQIASHKLRTPITAINWTAQMLTGDPSIQLPESIKINLQDIQLNADRLNNLTKILLNAAEIKNDRIAIHAKPLPLSELIKMAKLGVESRQNTEEKVELHFPDSTTLEKIQVNVDKEKMGQTLGILLENAFIYGQPNQLNKVELQVNVDKEKNKAVLTISDTGIGIPADEQHKVFTKFFRGANAKLKYTEGTGLSLFLANIIARSSNEKITFDSTENMGSKFTLSLPLVHEASEQAHSDQNQNNA